MRVFITPIAVLAAAWVAGAGQAEAAWNNVFQTCCNSCRQPSTSYYAAPAPTGGCCPTISYQQRCYYQPYTAYRQETVMEPVTSYRTSYYWEPVTSYRYTSYYDPCTCSCRQVCTPYTSYQLRSQCNAVQSYVQRCQMVPYTAYRQSCYVEPVVSYAAPVCPTSAAPAVVPAPAAPAVVEGTAPPAAAGPLPDRKPLPSVSEGTDRNIPPQNLQPNNRRVAPPPANSAPLRMDRITNNGNGRLQGTIVADDRITPKSGARLFFASSETTKPQFSAQADASGRFAVELPPGDWAMYMNGKDGKPVFHSQVSVKNSDQRLVTVVSR